MAGPRRILLLLSALFAVAFPAGHGVRQAAVAAAPAARRRPRRAARWLLAAAAAAAADGPWRVAAVDSTRAGSGVLVDMEELLWNAREHLDETGLMDKSVRRKLYELVSNIYIAADLDGDGVLGDREVEYANHLADELQRRAHVGDARIFQVGGPESEVLEPESAQLLLLSDLDRDGSVDWEEFRLLCHEQARRWAAVAVEDPEFFAEDPVVGAEIGETFARADISGDGALQQRELHFASFLYVDRLQRAMISSLLSRFDLDVDGSIRAEEVDQVVASLDMDTPAFHTALRIRSSFAAHDGDGDGSLSAMELYRLMLALLHRGGDDEVV